MRFLLKRLSHRFARHSTPLWVAALFAAGCNQVESPTVENSVFIAPKTGSSFVYDYEQHITPVKSDDVDTTYRFPLTARVIKDGISYRGMENCYLVRMDDELESWLPQNEYYWSPTNSGDVYYSMPYFSSEWIKLPFGTKQSFVATPIVEGELMSPHWKETRSSITYAGEETISVQDRSLKCEKVELDRTVRETDEWSNGDISFYHEHWTFWYAPEIRYFVLRKAEITDSPLHYKPKWKYETTEKLKSYTLVK